MYPRLLLYRFSLLSLCECGGRHKITVERIMSTFKLLKVNTAKTLMLCKQKRDFEAFDWCVFVDGRLLIVAEVRDNLVLRLAEDFSYKMHSNVTYNRGS